jgi:hypothetical protein
LSVGVHATFAVQAMHDPPLQTAFAPQLVPSLALLPVSLQTGVPDEHSVVPVWHGFVLGVHDELSTHAMQEPALQTRFVPHDEPFVRFEPVSLQTG